MEEDDSERVSQDIPKETKEEQQSHSMRRREEEEEEIGSEYLPNRQRKRQTEDDDEGEGVWDEGEDTNEKPTGRLQHGRGGGRQRGFRGRNRPYQRDGTRQRDNQRWTNDHQRGDQRQTYDLRQQLDRQHDNRTSQNTWNRGSGNYRGGGRGRGVGRERGVARTTEKKEGTASSPAKHPKPTTLGDWGSQMSSQTIATKEVSPKENHGSPRREDDSSKERQSPKNRQKTLFGSETVSKTTKVLARGKKIHNSESKPGINEDPATPSPGAGRGRGSSRSNKVPGSARIKKEDLEGQTASATEASLEENDEDLEEERSVPKRYSATRGSTSEGAQAVISGK